MGPFFDECVVNDLLQPFQFRYKYFKKFKKIQTSTKLSFNHKFKVRYAEYIDDFITLFDENIRSTILIDLSLIFSSTLVISLPLTPNLVFKTSTTALGSNPLNGVSSAATPNHALSNLVSTYHYSIPNVKLSYPEPFTASASFMHADLWFIHILTYQY